MEGGIDPRDHPFRPRCRFADRCMEGVLIRDGTPYHLPFSPRAAGFTNPSQSAISRWGSVFHTVRGGSAAAFVPGVLESCRLYMYRRGFLIRGWDLLLPGWHGGTGSTNPSQSTISRWESDFHAVRGVIDPGDHRFRPRYVGVVHVCMKGFLIRRWDFVLRRWH